MNHHFNVEIATRYGMAEAVILENMRFWVEHNRANGRSFHDGRYWTFNSVKAFEALFPYLKPSAIRRALSHLEDEGLIITGNYNSTPYDRTKWYALTDEAEAFFNSESSIFKNQQMEAQESANQIEEISKPIPDRKQDKRPVDKQRYGEFQNVLLTDEELEKLKAEFPTDWANRIEALDSYIAASGKKYRNHLATIRNWARRDREDVKRRADLHDEIQRRECEQYGRDHGIKSKPAASAADIDAAVAREREWQQKKLELLKKQRGTNT